jgi:hypothetical protein
MSNIAGGSTLHWIAPNGRAAACGHPTGKGKNKMQNGCIDQYVRWKDITFPLSE